MLLGPKWKINNAHINVQKNFASQSQMVDKVQLKAQHEQDKKL